ncbi:MAG TPA: FMN-binding protein [Aquifex aeolicus]|nr:FMN-binding protein [Aquifex aeolicus]
MRSLILPLLLSLVLLSHSQEREFGTPERVLSTLYPSASVEVRNIILTKEQKEKVEKLAKVRMESRLVSFYFVKEGDRVVAYGYVDTHRVRTHTESVLFVISPQGSIELVEVLAFNEPLEYMAEENWLALFKGKTLPRDTLRLRRDIPNITGATLTARAITKAARRAVALWKVLFGG